jgi:hypothetical protein
VHCILFTPCTVYCSHRALYVYTVHTVHCILFTPCTVYCSHRALYTVHTVHCILFTPCTVYCSHHALSIINSTTQSNKMHCIVHRYIILQYHVQHCYMFRSLMGSSSGSQIKATPHKNNTFYTYVGFVQCCSDIMPWWWSLGGSKHVAVFNVIL